jgi:cytochrome c peroxidase
MIALRIRKHSSIAVLLVSVMAGGMLAQAPTPWTGGDAEKGVDFPLPQRRVNGRRTDEASNGFSISWDGRLLMFNNNDYVAWNAVHPAVVDPTTNNYVTSGGGVAFCTFDKNQIVLSGSQPTFPNTCFGPINYRFRSLTEDADPSNYPPTTYPAYAGYSGGGYPEVPWSMGELGLRYGYDTLSDNLYPVPDDQLPVGAVANPFPSDQNGSPSSSGAYLTYYAYVTFQDQPRFWDTSTRKWTWPAVPATRVQGPNGDRNTYYLANTMFPNGVTSAGGSGNGFLVKRNGRAKLRIIVPPASSNQMPTVNVLEKWKPFRVSGTDSFDTNVWSTLPGSTSLVLGIDIPSLSEMWADNFEPTLSNDGHLMVGKGHRNLVNGDGGVGNANICVYYNQTAFGESGWTGPFHLHRLYERRNIVLAGRTIGERYPIARQPLKAYDGSIFPTTMNFEGGYTWLDPDGRFVVYTVRSGGVGKGQPQAPLQPYGVFDDGGGNSNRASTSIVGSVTGWQQWRIDHPAENPSRHHYTAWDPASRTVHQRVASFGSSPGFWDMLRGANGIPERKDGKPKLHLINSLRLKYYELDLSPFMDLDYGFYLPMTEMLAITPGTIDTRDVDITRTPDLSGNGNFGHVENGAMLPCEYFELPGSINPISTVGGWHYIQNGRFVPVSHLTSPLASQAAPLIGPNWTASDVVADANGDWWAKIADWEEGVNGLTTPFDGRGSRHDMDSDTHWGRVGQAMFFPNTAQIRITNNGTKPELNPGTNLSGASSGFTCSFWLRQMQGLTSGVTLFQHNFSISLSQTGQITATLQSAGAGTASLSGGSVLPNKWTHIALTWRNLNPNAVPPDGASTAILYVNGVKVMALDLAFDNLALSTSDILFGCLGSPSSSTDAVFLFDEVALKNSAVEPEEVSALALQPIPTPTWTNTNLPPAPLGFDNSVDARVPSGSPYTASIASLGADLFHDRQLSTNKAISCSTCHLDSRAFTEPLAITHGFTGTPLLRNTPTIFNQRFQTAQFWDARAASLEDQALAPVFNPNEMGGMTWSQIAAYLAADAQYPTRFALAGLSITEANVRRAIATYMRSPTTGDSVVDRAALGGTLNPAVEHGKALFHGKARCIACHNGPNFTDGLLWSTGTVRSNGFDDGASREDSGRRTALRKRFFGAFKTPSLRDLGSTGPYFHDGHATTLDEVVQFYNAGGVRQDGLGFPFGTSLVTEEVSRPLGLTAGDASDLVAYLDALQGHTVSAGAIGFNSAPVAVIQSLVKVANAQVLTVDITDPDGATDIDPNITDSLLVSTPVIDALKWPNATVSSIAGGKRAVFNLAPQGYPAGSIVINYRDYHGRSGVTVTN